MTPTQSDIKRARKWLDDHSEYDCGEDFCTMPECLFSRDIKRTIRRCLDIAEAELTRQPQEKEDKL